MYKIVDIFNAPFGSLQQHVQLATFFFLRMNNTRLLNWGTAQALIRTNS
jgi:hypothetical protein